MTTKSRTPYVSNYASNLFNQSPEEYKLFIQAKVGQHNELSMMLREAHLYHANNPEDAGIKTIINSIRLEMKNGYADGACLHPEIYKTKLGSKWFHCKCCNLYMYK